MATVIPFSQCCERNYFGPRFPGFISFTHLPVIFSLFFSGASHTWNSKLDPVDSTVPFVVMKMCTRSAMVCTWWYWYRTVLVNFWWYWVTRWPVCLYILKKVEICYRSLTWETTLKDRATQFLRSNAIQRQDMIYTFKHFRIFLLSSVV